MAGRKRCCLHCCGIWIQKYEIHLLVVFGEGIYFEQIPQYVRVTHIFPCKSKEATKEIREHAAKLYEQYVKESYDVMVAFLEGPSTKILSCCNDPMCRKYAWMHTNLKNVTARRYFTKALKKKNMHTVSTIRLYSCQRQFASHLEKCSV